MKPFRVLGVAGKVLGLAVTFVVAAALGALLHIGLPAPRRVVVGQVNQALDDTFKGKIIIHDVARLGLMGASGVEASVVDPEGRRVLWAHGVGVRFSAMTFIRSIMSGGGWKVVMPHVSADDVDARVEEDSLGRLGVQRAFEPAHPNRSAHTDKDIYVEIEAVEVRRTWVHGQLSATPLDVVLERMEGAFESTPRDMKIDLRRVAITGRGFGEMNPEGELVAHASLPSHDENGRQVRAQFEGHVGRVALAARAGLDGEVVDAWFDVPETDASDLNALAPAILTLKERASAHAEAHGTLPVVWPELVVHLGAGELHAAGTVTLPEGAEKRVHVNLTTRARDIDLSLAIEKGPVSRLGALIHADAMIGPGGAVVGTFELTSEVGRAAGQIVPAIGARGAFTERTVHGIAQVAEPGAPTEVAFDLHPKPGVDTSKELVLGVETEVPDLERVARLGPLGQGHGKVRIDASIDLDAKTVDAVVKGELAGFRRGDLTFAYGTALGTAKGSLDEPSLIANVDVGDLHAGGYEFTRARGLLRGSLDDLAVGLKLTGADTSPTVDAAARIDRRSGLVIRGARIAIARNEVMSTTTIKAVRVAKEDVRIEGLRTEGLGAPITAEVHVAGERFELKAQGADVDVACIAALLAREEDARGHMSFDVDVKARRKTLSGRIAADLSGVSFRNNKNIWARIVASLEGDRASLSLHGAIDELGKVDVEAPSFALAGDPRKVDSWERATGRVELEGAVDVAKLLELVPIEERPIGAAAGSVSFRGAVTRSAPSSRLGVELAVATRGLEVAGKQQRTPNPDGSNKLGPAPWSIAGIDVRVDAKLDGSSGETTFKAAVEDKTGLFASVDGKTKVSLEEIVRSGGDVRDVLARLPIEFRLAVPRRSLAQVPAALQKTPLRGDVELTIDAKGTLDRPDIEIRAHGYQLVLPREAGAALTGAKPKALDVELLAKYDGERAQAHLGMTREGRKVLDSDATMQAKLADLRSANSLSDLAWEASGNVALDGFPIENLAPLSDQHFSGALSGKLVLRDLHRAAHFEAELRATDLVVSKTAFSAASVKFGVDRDAMTASVRLDAKDGFAEAKASAVVKWGAEVAPSLDRSHPLTATLVAKNFRADALRPLVEGVFDELDGRIDANFGLSLDRDIKATKAQGTLVFRQGSFEVSSIGEKFHDVRAKVTLEPSGVIKVSDMVADAPTGRVSVNASADISGMTLRLAEARIRIAKGQKIPISIAGVPMGDAYGDVTAKAGSSSDGRTMNVVVDVPLLHVDLPHAPARGLQAMKPDEHVRVGVHQKGEFDTVSLFAPEKAGGASDMHWRVQINLGSDVSIKKETLANVFLDGKPVVDVGNKTRVSGSIRVTRGTLEVQGKRFTIEHALVTFTGEPTNPTIVASAYWDAPDGTRIHAEFLGPVKTGKLTLKSEPEHTQDEILALIMFGSVDGQFGTQPSTGQNESAGAQAVGAAGSFVTQGINKALSGISAVEIESRVDTSEADNPRPEVAVQLGRNVTAQLSYSVGVPAPGDKPDRTELSLDWRFQGNWSLDFTVGDQGSTGVDLLWRKRY